MKGITRILMTALAVLVTVDVGYGIPAFSRKYKTSCSTCHYAAPMLNGFGKAFKNNGYRYPAGADPFPAHGRRAPEPVI
jgi:thiol-disulfide isomerase/thioredoxin